jgi:hypothetical protein
VVGRHISVTGFDNNFHRRLPRIHIDIPITNGGIWPRKHVGNIEGAMNHDNISDQRENHPAAQCREHPLSEDSPVAAMSVSTKSKYIY